MKPRRFPKWLRKLFRRRMLIAFLIVIQAAFFIYLVASRSMVSQRLSRLLQIISVLAVLYIVSKRDKGAYKTLWVFLILCFPIFGGLLYLLVTCQTTTRLMRRDIQNVQEKTKDLYDLPGDSYAQAEEITGSHFPQIRYLQDYVGYPVTKGFLSVCPVITIINCLEICKRFKK